MVQLALVMSHARFVVAHDGSHNAMAGVSCVSFARASGVFTWASCWVVAFPVSVNKVLLQSVALRFFLDMAHKLVSFFIVLWLAMVSWTFVRCFGDHLVCSWERAWGSSATVGLGERVCRSWAPHAPLLGVTGLFLGTV